VGERRRAIVLITDGYDEHSQSAFDAAVGSLRKSQSRYTSWGSAASPAFR
jgi:hypothetical protein